MIFECTQTLNSQFKCPRNLSSVIPAAPQQCFYSVDITLLVSVINTDISVLTHRDTENVSTEFSFLMSTVMMCFCKHLEMKVKTGLANLNVVIHYVHKCGGWNFNLTNNFSGIMSALGFNSLIDGVRMCWRCTTGFV